MVRPPVMRNLSRAMSDVAPGASAATFQPLALCGPLYSPLSTRSLRTTQPPAEASFRLAPWSATIFNGSPRADALAGEAAGWGGAAGFGATVGAAGAGAHAAANKPTIPVPKTRTNARRVTS